MRNFQILAARAPVAARTPERLVVHAVNSWRGGNVRRWTVDSERWYSHVNVDNEQW